MTKNLNARQLKALSALLSGKTKTEAATEAGVSRQAMTKWLSDPVFKQALADGEAQLLSELNRQLLQLGSSAIEQLKTVLDKPDSQAVGVRASNVVLSKLLSIRELTEIEDRLGELEERLGNEK